MAHSPAEVAAAVEKTLANHIRTQVSDLNNSLSQAAMLGIHVEIGVLKVDTISTSGAARTHLTQRISKEV